MVQKLNKIQITIFAVALGALMLASPMALQIVSAGQGYADHKYGVSYSYEDCSQPNNEPSYMECVHTDLYAPDDMMVGVYVNTNYQLYNSNDYNYGNFWFSAQAGYNSATVSIMPPMGMTFDLDYSKSTAYRLIYYDYSSGTWTNGYLFNGKWAYLKDDNQNIYSAYVVSDQYNSAQNNLNFGLRNSAAGMTQEAFYYNNNHNTVYYHYAQTQVPSGNNPPPAGILGYNFLTAHPYSQGGDWS